MRFTFFFVAFVSVFVSVSACRPFSSGPESELQRGNGKRTFYNLLIVGSRDNQADINIIVTFQKDYGIYIHSLQRDFAKYTDYKDCTNGIKLTDNLAAKNGDIFAYKKCVESLMDARFQAIRDLKPDGNYYTHEKSFGVSHPPFVIDQVLHLQLANVSEMMRVAMNRFGPLNIGYFAQNHELIIDSFKASCNEFRNLTRFILREQFDYICKFNIFEDLAKIGSIKGLNKVRGQWDGLLAELRKRGLFTVQSSALTSVGSEERFDRFKSTAAKNVKDLADCVQIKIRERGSDISELKVRSCIGHVSPGLAGSFQREFSAAQLVAEVLGYVNVFRRNYPKGYQKAIKSICDGLNCSTQKLDFLELDRSVGAIMQMQRFEWKDNYSPIPIVVWDGVRESGLGYNDAPPPSYAVILNGKATYYDRSGKFAEEACEGRLVDSLPCYIAYPSTSNSYEDRKYKGNDGSGEKYGLLPWMVPPPRPVY